MNDLTTVLLYRAFDIKVEEWSKQGQGVGFDSGIEQRIVNYSIPAIEMTILYRGLSFSDYTTLRNSFENNNTSTFTFLPDDSLALDFKIDMRPVTMQDKSGVWAFKDFKFKIDAKVNKFEGEIKLITSVLFNFPKLTYFYDNDSSYVRSDTTDSSFLNILDYAQPNRAELGYLNNSIFSNIGESIRHARNKGGLKRTWILYWLINESNFLKLLTFYRKNAGIMGEFGIPEYGSTSPDLYYAESNYILNQDDYVYYSYTDALSNARFLQDSFKYQKRVDGLYQCSANFVEVKL
jgi:hypothetical protein